MTSTTLGIIVGNRGFFPKHLCVSGRETILRVLASEGIGVVALELDETPYGSIESLADAHKCAELFQRHRENEDREQKPYRLGKEFCIVVSTVYRRYQHGPADKPGDDITKDEYENC